MVKRGEQNHIQANDKGVIVTQTQIADDYPLPPADELAKLKEVNPELINFIMERAKQEQEMRHEELHETLNLEKEETKHRHRRDYFSLVLAFLIVIAAFGISYSLLTNGFGVVGTIFAGATLVVVVGLFLNPKYRDEDKK